MGERTNDRNRQSAGADETLAALRGRLDGLDRELLALFRERMALCAGIAACKAALGLGVRDAVREEEKLCTVSALSGDELRPYSLALFRTLFSLSRARQRELLGLPDDEA